MTPVRRQIATLLPHDGGAEPRRSPSGRAGATLVEILMAILIMAVGIVSVFTLFPIAVLRTIKATQDTNSKILKLNVDEIVSSSPTILTAFESGTQIRGTASQYRGEWEPNANPPYVDNEVVVPTLKAGSPLPRPLVLFRATITAGTGVSGTTEPIWSRTALVTESAPASTIEWRPIADNYVVDPWGWNIADDDALGAAVRDSFGNKTDTSTGTALPLASAPLLRIHGSLNDTETARSNVCMLDNWEEVFSGTPLSATFTTVTLPPSVDLTGIAQDNSRVAVTFTDGSKTAYRRIASINTAGGVITLNDAERISNLATSFPQAGGNPDIGTVRVEILNRRFSWFLTIRNVRAQPEINCVVVFNRNMSTANEHTYAANFGNPIADLDGDGAADSTHGLTSTNQVMVAWQPGAATAWDPEGTGANANEPDPLLKPGNWLFDAQDASWYRIQSIDNSSSTTATPRWSILSLDQPARVVSTDDGSGPPPVLTPPGRAILMPGVVQVFDL